MKRYFLGIDIGTFESRGILIDESFRVAADASVPHGMDNPQPGWFEQEAVDRCDGAVEIPQAGTKHSVNVSVSGGVVLWSFFCQIRPKR